MAGTKFALALTAIVLNLTASAAAFPEGQNPQSPGSMRGDRLAMYRAAGIDKEQEAKLTALTRDFESDVVPKTRSLIKLMGEMRALSLQPDPDQKAVLVKQDEINKANGEISLDRIKFALQMRSVLTPDQKQKFVQLMQQNSRKAEGTADSTPQAAPAK